LAGKILGVHSRRIVVVVARRAAMVDRCGDDGKATADPCGMTTKGAGKPVQMRAIRVGGDPALIIGL
jgi:hypothetical protein